MVGTGVGLQTTGEEKDEQRTDRGNDSTSRESEKERGHEKEEQRKEFFAGFGRFSKESESQEKRTEEKSAHELGLDSEAVGVGKAQNNRGTTVAEQSLCRRDAENI